MSAKDKRDSKVLVSNQKDVKEGREEITKVHTRTVIAQTEVRQR
jgi:ATP-dependent Zn protease